MNKRSSPKDFPAAAPERCPVWARYSLGGDHEDFIVGSPDGLRVLRDHIDEAIQSGESMIQNTEIGIIGIQCRESPSDIPLGLKPWQTMLAHYGYFALVLAVSALAVYGALALFR